MRRPDCRRLLWLGSALLAGAAVASSFFASDTTRMVGILFPVVAVGSAVFVQSTATLSPVVGWGFVALVAAKGPVTLANQLFGPGSAVLTAQSVDLIVFAAGSVLLIVALAVIRRGSSSTDPTAARSPG